MTNESRFIILKQLVMLHPYSHSIISCACKPAKNLAFWPLIFPSTVMSTVIGRVLVEVVAPTGSMRSGPKRCKGQLKLQSASNTLII